MKKKGKKTDSFLRSPYGKNTCLALLITRGYGEKEIGFPFQVFGNKWTRDKIPHVGTTKEGVGRVLSCAKNQNSLVSPIYHDLEGLLIKLPGWAGAG